MATRLKPTSGVGFDRGKLFRALLSNVPGCRQNNKRGEVTGGIAGLIYDLATRNK